MGFLPPPPSQKMCCASKKRKKSTKRKGEGIKRKTGEENQRKIERGRRKERKRAGNCKNQRFKV